MVDYPLTLIHLQFSSEIETQVMIDDIACQSQGEKEGSLFVRAVSTKPTGLLYRNDSLNVAIANAWLWGKPVDVTFEAALQESTAINGRSNQEKCPSVPGEEQVQAAQIKALPLVPTASRPTPRAKGRTAASTSDKKGFLVYEPSGKPLPPAESAPMLGDRNRVLMDLGFKRETMVIPWHSIDGHPSVETFMGSWTSTGLRRTSRAG